MATPESESFVRTFARGLAVIEAMGDGPYRKNLAEIAEAVELPRTAVRRFLLTLIELSFVQTDGKRYWLTPRVLRLGLSYLNSLPYWRQAQLSLEELCARIKQSCALSVLDGEHIVYIQRQHSKRILPMSPSLGSRLPAHAVSMGRVMLAGLPDEELDHYLQTATLKPLTSATVVDPGVLRERILQARKQGYAWIDSELDESICGLAVPVRDQEGNTIAAINVSLPTGQVTQEEAVKLYLAELRQAASQLRAATL
ncbi:MAG: IclR family transcriptional regulator C-terminal domain-containing protein [Pigmentiphaga sp.]|uniref:IclR family transcriptional regulator domain-containing protein n=1 Tax=Pigmentiphaga sp. TaxID=1977564 RepID=UPI0029AC71DF|nr:IclR family transcriptional regulator C-terminal domain-containing protein [Pigmentiphaga sp.]MDX3906193.1 IclR family transcriptional regulator C-terminal domain-containing protein [Pigmentiphaga sp.]